MSFVLVEKPRPQIALVTLNRPDRMNAMAFDVMMLIRLSAYQARLVCDTGCVGDRR